MHAAHDTLLHSWQLVAFRDMPSAYQMAIAWYMAVDSRIWSEGDLALDCAIGCCTTTLKTRLEQAMPRFIGRRGAMLFGMSHMPMDVARQAVLRGADLEAFDGDWAAYHAWYLSQGGVPEHPANDRWPCIMSQFADELFEDGWHRFHSYCRSGHTDLPVVFFPGRRHRRAARST